MKTLVGFFLAFLLISIPVAAQNKGEGGGAAPRREWAADTFPLMVLLRIRVRLLPRVLLNVLRRRRPKERRNNRSAIIAT